MTRAAQPRKIPRWIENLTYATEKQFRLPFTSYRFGWDAIIGLVPGIGDFIGMVIGMSIVFAAHRLDASKRVMAKMVGNLALDAFLGSIPVVGDMFDFFFKANSKNLKILQREMARQGSAA